jgi:hypothetical protein
VPHEEMSFNASFSRLKSKFNRSRSEERPPSLAAFLFVAVDRAR